MADYTQDGIDSASDKLILDVQSGVHEAQIRDRMVKKMDIMKRKAFIDSVTSDIQAETDGGLMRWKDGGVS